MKIPYFPQWIASNGIFSTGSHAGCLHDTKVMHGNYGGFHLLTSSMTTKIYKIFYWNIQA